MGTKQEIIQFEFGDSAPSLLNQAISIHGIDLSYHRNADVQFWHFQREYTAINGLFLRKLLTQNEYEKAIKRLNLQINNYIKNNRLQ